MMHTLNDFSELLKNCNDMEIHYQKWNVEFRDSFFKDVYWTYFPLTEKYYFEANPSFLYEYRNIFDLGRYPVILVRDGFVGIVDFFIVHPKPNQDFTGKLLIPKKFEKLVPTTWKDQVYFYCVKSRVKKESKEELLVYGIAMDDIFLKDKVEEKINQIYEMSRKYKKVTFVIQPRESIISKEEERLKRRDQEFLKHLFLKFGGEVDVHFDAKPFMKKFNSKDFSFYNIDQNQYLISDNFLDHFFASKGGFCLNENDTVEEEYLKYRLSIYHDIYIDQGSHSKSIFPDYFIPSKVKGLVRSNIYLVYKNEFFQNLFIKNF